MYSKRLSFIDKVGNNCGFTIYVHNKEDVRTITKSYNNKGFIVIIEDSPLPNADCHAEDYSKGYRL